MNQKDKNLMFAIKSGHTVTPHTCPSAAGALIDRGGEATGGVAGAARPDKVAEVEDDMDVLKALRTKPRSS